jgi:hypothetical protein
MILNWHQSANLPSRSYTCGYCGNSIASAIGYFADHFITSGSPSGHRAYIYVCHKCDKPTFFNAPTIEQIPGAKFGNEVKDIDDVKVASLYDEARRTFSQNAFTSVVLSCRKLLMHVAVAKGAPEGQNFIQYVEYLSTQNYIPPDAKGWVDHIRQKGNEANHEIVIMIEEDAKDLIGFSEMLLKLIYEFPANIKRKIFPQK